MKHYHKNPRQITKRQMTDLQKWLVEFGDLSGIVHNIPTDEIIGGNQRSEALPGVISGLIQPVITERYDPPLEDGTVCNGYYEIDGRKYTYRGVNWDDKKAERANLIANKAGGTFDMDILANQFDLPVLLDSGFEERELIGFDFGEPKDAEPQIDRAAELLEKWQVKTGDLWQIGEHRLICGDCTDAAVVARVMGGEKADFSVTDPPYNVKVLEDNDDMTDEQFIEWCKLWAAFMPNSFVLTVGIKKLLLWHAVLGLPQWIISWVKMNGQGRTGLGGGNGKWDPILLYNVPQDCGIDVLEINNDYRGTLESGGFHLTGKPIKLWTLLIERFGGQIIYEPFSGSGTTLVACQNLGRRGRAIEISPAYCAVTLQRMSDAFPELEITRIEDGNEN